MQMGKGLFSLPGQKSVAKVLQSGIFYNLHASGGGEEISPSSLGYATVNQKKWPKLVFKFHRSLKNALHRFHQNI